MKRILGLDLGTNSIGWALVNEAENETEKSSIVKLGVRVNPLTTDEQQNFEKGKSITTNADRTLKRSMRRNLQRYKLRRENLIEILQENGFITENTILSEDGNRTTFETYRLRAKAAKEEITLEQFARVLLMINKKRGYKSSRKAKSDEEGQLIDGMEVAKRLYLENITPGQLTLELINAGKKYFPEFYRSDLQNEFDRIYTKQQDYYPEFLTEELRANLKGKKREAVWVICEKAFKENEFDLVGIKREGNAVAQRNENFEWRAKGLTDKLSLEEVVIILQHINQQINGSSGYLGSISDRSKELFFNKVTLPGGKSRSQTVGEYQMALLDANPNASLRNMVFYRQDYLDEFDIIWEKQAEYHKELTSELKKEIRDVIIFYQRPLKSQKGLISFCEFESKKKVVEVDGKKKEKTVGSRVIPRSSPLFQEFKIWQVLNNIEVFGKASVRKKKQGKNLFSETEDPLEYGGRRALFLEEKELLAAELSIKKELKKSDILKLLFGNAKDLDMNYKVVQGNLTNYNLFNAYRQIIERSGHQVDFDKDTSDVILENVKDVFGILGINTDILTFATDQPLDQQPMYKLWHLLYSFEGDNSKTGNENLIQRLSDSFGFTKEYAIIMANVVFQDDYGNLSAKAIRKILPYLKAGNKYDVACGYEGYRHSASSLTKEEIENKILKDRLELLPKNSLRNPVVEKILNQMVNVINSIIDSYGKPDEIRIELARELKKSQKEREELTKAITDTTKLHEHYREILSKPPFNLSYISRNDIIRYKLYEELKENGYKTLYSNTYISPASLFGGDFDVEHIIPQARLFDDSFSNKTLELRNINLEKGDKTALDFINSKYGETGHECSLDNYQARIDDLLKKGGITKAKANKLKMKEKDIPEDFLNRDLRDTQYIARYARAMLSELVKNVVSTTGSITDRLREDWQLIDVMKELNWNKYHKLGLTEEVVNDKGQRINKIKDWTKRNDHRHHAVDALTVAFTKQSYIQYLNNLNARSDKSSSIYGIEKKELYRNEKNKLLFKPPIPLDEFRQEARKQLENTLISIKAKNKVVTQNVNNAKKIGGVNKRTQLTPRGQLHNETIYGSQKSFIIKKEPVNAKMTAEKIATVTSPLYKEALLRRLLEFGNDPKKAFTGSNALDKKPVWLDDLHTRKVPEMVKTVTTEIIYTIRKDINHELKIEKVIDKRIKQILEARLKEYDNNAKKAFSNLEENPIWIDKEKKIALKRVTITGISNAEALHDKRDKEGNLLPDKEGKRQPVDFVNTGNNHHVAIYRDASGNLQENVVSFYEAVNRKNLGLPVIDKELNAQEGWKFLFTMKQNEYFVFPRFEEREIIDENTGEVRFEKAKVFDPGEIDLLNPDNYHLISPNLFRVQKITIKDYFFRHHLETKVEYRSELKDFIWIRCGLSGIEGVVKVRINHLGDVVAFGE